MSGLCPSHKKRTPIGVLFLCERAIKKIFLAKCLRDLNLTSYVKSIVTRMSNFVRVIRNIPKPIFSAVGCSVWFSANLKHRIGKMRQIRLGLNLHQAIRPTIRYIFRFYSDSASDRCHNSRCLSHYHISVALRNA